jgi:hypothetical protein
MVNATGCFFPAAVLQNLPTAATDKRVVDLNYVKL